MTSLFKGNPETASTYFNRGNLLKQSCNWEEAASSYLRCIEINPNFYGYYYNLGEVLVKMSKWKEAESAYRRACELNENSAWAWHNLGEVLQQLGNLDNAISAYRKAIEKCSDFYEFYNSLGKALYLQDHLDESVFHLRKAIELDSESALPYQNLWDVLSKLGRIDEGIDCLKRAVQLNPADGELYQKLAEALHEKNELAAAVTYYRKAIQLKPDLHSLHYKLGTALSALGQWQESVTAYRKAAELESNLSIDNVLPINEPTTKELFLELLNRSPIQVTDPASHFSSREFRQPSSLQTDVRLIAYYLPQFHPIPENDLWWGKGFTEWTNVTRAQPLFEGHYQPHLPADLGFYDLRLPEAREAQAALAKKYGIYGFCYYYYWFAGKRLLNRPIDEVLRTKKPDFPFCICWANENWTRRWDGAEHEVLMAQECWSDEQNQAFAESIVPILRDERYIRINGAPLLIVYRRDLFPDLRRTAEQWRKIFRKEGVGEVHLCVAITFSGLHTSLEELGFDSAVQFPPHGFSAREVFSDEINVENFTGHLYDFKSGVLHSLSQDFPGLKVFRSVMTSWDNTARRRRSAHAFVYSSPEVYELWLRGIIEKTTEVHSGEERLVFINAWNEWAEGAHLEPDQKYGHSYLLATRRALDGTHSWKTIIDLLRYIPIKSISHLHAQLDGLDRRIAAMNQSLEAMEKLIDKTVKVVSISPYQESPELLWQLDCPRVEIQVSVNSIILQGWAVGQNSPAVAVNIMSDGSILQQTPIDIPRPDVAQVHPLPGAAESGFSITLEVAGLSSEICLQLEVLLEDGSCIPTQTIGLRRGFVDTKQSLNLSPEQQVLLNYSPTSRTQMILALMRSLSWDSLEHLRPLLDELEKVVQVKELRLQAIKEILMQMSVQEFYKQV